MAENTGRPLSPEETEKIRAETLKLQAETEQAAVRAELDFQKLRADARKAEAEASNLEIKLREEERRQKTLLADDIYHHVYRFSDTVSSSSVASCMSRLAYWDRNDPKCPIEIIFSSPGGSVIDGMVLFDYIGTIRRSGHKVTTSTMGWAASMAGILLQAGDHRVMYREAWVLIHEVSFGTSGKIGEIEDTVNWARRMDERVIDIFTERCRQAGVAGTANHPLSRAKIKKGWTRKDWWLDSAECLDFGLVDEVR